MTALVVGAWQPHAGTVALLWLPLLALYAAAAAAAARRAPHARDRPLALRLTASLALLYPASGSEPLVVAPIALYPVSVLVDRLCVCVGVCYVCNECFVCVCYVCNECFVCVCVTCATSVLCVCVCVCVESGEWRVESGERESGEWSGVE